MVSPSRPQRVPSERSIVFLIGAVQFVNILDFMIVMPLGPDFAVALGIPTSKLGLIGGSYTAAAAVAGLVGSLFLDRFDRRSALAVALSGLVLGTAAGGLAVGLGTLMAARLLAGFFGGPATSLAMSIVADTIPPARRGRALGAVMGAFSVASVLGVPAGLELAQRFGWRAPLFAVAGLGLVVNAGAVLLLPPLRGHLYTAAPGSTMGLRSLLARRLVRRSYAMTAVVMMGGFVLIPNISAYLQQNLRYPRDRLGLLYMMGGLASFISMRLVGRLVDRHGPFRVGTLGCALLLLVLYTGFYAYLPGLPVTVLFVSFMVAMSFRNVAYNTLASRVPGAGERARFLSIQSAVQHVASAAGAFLSAHLLREMPDMRLQGVERIALLSMLLTALLPLLMHEVERGVLARERARNEATPLTGAEDLMSG
ncbi:MAG: MFS transporter [Myxococcales bacterium]|nr:MFS transporter [Myxococcota bacterium]MDW8281851.1 MFS transporter [Myxococcales bacterium]